MLLSQLINVNEIMVKFQRNFQKTLIIIVTINLGRKLPSINLYIFSFRRPTDTFVQ